jgi:3-methyladenine DNA glycosylase AlkC
MTSEYQTHESGLWKNSVDGVVVTDIAKKIGLVEPGFDRAGFVRAVTSDNLEDRELKDRIATLARHLHHFLPTDYSRTVDILIAVAPELGGWGNWVLTGCVERYGLDHLEDSIRALEELTKHGSSEFAIRPFMIRYPDRMLEVLDRWADDPNEHVRRLAAEGSRPRGVWVQHIEAFKKDPRPVVNILDKLRADESLYVRKAVANNLNDISKDHPQIAIKTARRWRKDKNRHTDWIIKHGCRTLIKQGHPDIFPLLGFTASPEIEVAGFRTKPKRVTIGQEMQILFDLVSKAKQNQKLVIDYRVHYIKSGGKLSSRVFKLTQKTLAPGETVPVTTSHSFVDRSTRKHHPGTHRLELLVNGVGSGTAEFRLTR